jgi:hypothetical protein
MEIDALADRLIASCEGGSTADNDMIAEMTGEECKVLDGKAFMCTGCDQWFDLSDMHDADAPEWLCTDCGRG